MHWKLKAAIQNAIAVLPESVSYPLYYRVQRMAGGLRRINPTSRLRAGIEVWRRLQQSGCDPVGKTFFEVGTGRMVTAPLAYWLMGARKIITVDLNPYLRPELVQESIRFLADHRAQMAELFGELLLADRIDQLVGFAQADRFDLSEFLEAVGIEYRAPSDAAATGLPDRSIDFHTSYTVLEHIPPAVLSAIFAEASRLLKPGGLAVHGIDYSDHFAHRDPSITAINFLQYSDAAWGRWAGNRYMYMNRLRHADYLERLADGGFSIVNDEPTTDPRSLQAIESGEVRPYADLASRTPAELAITSSWIVAKPTRAAEAPAA